MSSRRAAKQRRSSNRPSFAKKPSRDRRGVSKVASALMVAVMVIAAVALVLIYSSGSADQDGLKASFEMDAEEGFTPLTVHFTDTSSGGPTEWEWDFNGDTVIDSYERNPSWTYRFGGEYEVTLTVYDGSRSDAAVKVVTVSARLTADFSYAPASGSAPLTVQFTDLSTGNRSEMQYAWDFGDGTRSNEMSPQHTYIGQGSYNVVLTVSEGDQHKSKSVTIEVTLIPPQASFVVQTEDPRVGSEVLFKDTSAHAPSNWTWDFGDGAKGYGRQPPGHVYAQAGNYTVTLTAWNMAGGNTTSKIVQVRELTVQAMFSASANQGPAPLTVAFKDHSTSLKGDIVSWRWDFGDGTVSEARNPQHTYDVGRDAPYVITLTVSNGVDTATMVYEIEVLATDPPAVDFVANPRVGIDSVVVKFTDLSANRPSHWEWDFNGDGIVDSYDQDPTFEYKSYGSYDVTLNASNEYGYTIVTKHDYIVINTNQPVASFEADRIKGAVPLTVKFTDTSLCNPLEWEWDFGDGATSDKQHPEHTYNDVGTYVVKLKVTNRAGSAECEKIITVVPREVGLDVSLRSDMGWATVYDEIVFSIDLRNTGTVDLNNLRVTLTLSGLKPTVYLDEYVHLAAGAGTTITYHYEVSWGDTESQYLDVALDVAASSGEEFSDGLVVSMVRTTYSWTSSGGDDYNSGWSYEAGPIGPETPLLKWSRDLNGDLVGGSFAQPLIVEMKRQNGEIMDVIFVGEPYPMAIDLNTGAEIWNRSDLKGHVYTPVYHDGVLYFGDMALNARNGALLWTCDGLVGSITPVKYDGGRLYVGGLYDPRNGGLFCIDAATGSILWLIKNHDPAQFGAPAIVGSYVIWPSAIGSKPEVVVTDKVTGAITDVVDLAAVAWGNNGDVIPKLGRICSSVVYSPEAGRIYFTILGAWFEDKFNGLLVSMAYDPVKGDVVERDNWLTRLPFQSSCSPVVHDGKIYVGLGNYRVGSVVSCWERNGTLIETIAFTPAQCNPVLSLYGGEPVLYWPSNLQIGLLNAYAVGARPGFSFIPGPGMGDYSMAGAVPYKGYLVYTNDRGYIFCLQSYSADPSIDPRQSINYETATVGNMLEYQLDVVNDGNVDFRGVKVKVTMEGYAISGYTIVDETIDIMAGNTKSYHFSYPVTAMDVQGTNIKFYVVCTVDGHVFSNSTTVIMETPAFRIDSDAEMDQMASSRGWTGSGTADDPYVISGYFVDGRQGGIYIGNTTRYFILRDVEVSNATSGAGIELLDVVNGVIADSYLHDNKYGIHAKGSTVIIRSNIIANNTLYGVLLDGCVDSKIYSNHFISNNGATSKYSYADRQASDDDMDGGNAWDVSGTGNLWSDVLGANVVSYMVDIGVYDHHPLGINDGDWEGSMDDAQGSGSNTAPSPDQAEEYWAASLGSPLVGAPIMADGLVIFVTVEGLYVFDDAGHLKWSDRSYTSDNGTVPCYSDGKIYIAYPKTPTTSSIVVRSYDAFTGSVIWQVNNVGSWKTPSSPLRVYDGKVFVTASRDGGSALLCLDNRTGAPQWSLACDGAKVFVLVGEHIIVAYGNGTLASVSSSDGSLVDTVDVFEHFPILRSNLSSSISYDVVSCSIFLVTEGRDLACLGFDPLTGQFLPSHVRQGYTVPLKYPGSTPVVSNDAVYVISGSLVYAIDKTTGEVRWMYQLRSAVTSSPAVSTYYDGDLIYIVCQERVLCLDSEGRLVWQLAPKDYALCYDSTYGAALSGTLLAYGNDLGNVMVVKKRINLDMDLKIETDRWDARVGDKITVTITAKNTGNVRLDDLPLYFVRIVDNKIVQTYIDTGNRSVTPKLDLAIGQVYTRTFSYTVTAEDFAQGSIYFKATSNYAFQDASFDIVLYHALGMTHDPVVIDGDDELREFADEFNLMGDGSASNPYVLAAWLINAEDSRYCISISNTTLHFIISDCVLHNATDESAKNFRSVDDYGGFLWKQDLGYQIWEAHPHNPTPAPWAGIRLYRASNIVIQGSTFEGCYVSIEMFECTDIRIDDVDIELYPASGSSGINILNCERIDIRNSHVTGLGLDDAEALQEMLEIDTIPEIRSTAQYDLVEWYGIRAASSDDITIEGTTFESFAAYHTIYNSVLGGTTPRPPGVTTDVWINMYRETGDAWAVFINNSAEISVRDNTFTESHSLSVRMDGSEDISIDGNVFDSYLKRTVGGAESKTIEPYAYRDYLASNLQLNGCERIEISNNQLYNTRLEDCTDVLVDRNEVMVLGVDLPQAYASGVLRINGTNVVVSNNNGGNLYIIGDGHVIRDNAYRSIVLDNVHDSLVTGNTLSSSRYDLFVHNPLMARAGGLPLLTTSYYWYDQPLVTGTIILVDSDHIDVRDNHMNIYLWGSSYNSITNNVIEGGMSFGGYCINRPPGLNSGTYNFPSGEEEAILNTIFRSNLLGQAGHYGVGLEIGGGVDHPSEYNLIWNNTISHTLSYGILINDIYCHFNLIYENVLDSNNGATKSYDLSEQAQALDKGYLNQWNSTDKIGNYWSDWQHRNGPYCVSNGSVSDVAYDMYPMSFPLQYWEQYRMDEKGTAAIDSNGLFDPNNLTADWSFVMDKLYTGAITVEPVTGDGKVFVVDANSYVYAIDIDSGELRWAVNPIRGDNYGIESCTPAYNGKVLYVVMQCRVSSNTVSVVALSTADGYVLWTTAGIDTQGGRVDSPVRYDSGRIYFGSSGSNASLYCLSAVNGSMLWSYKTDASMSRSGATVVGDYVIFGDASGKLYVLNSTGAVKSTYDMNAKLGTVSVGINSTAVYSDGRLYFTASSKTVGYCISIGIDASGQLKGGEVRWTTMDPTSSSPALYNGYIYVGSGKTDSTYGRLYCIEADTGRAVWSRILDGPVLSSPTIMIMFHGDIYVGVTTANSIGGLYIYDNDGERVFAHVPPEDEAGYSIQGAAIFDETMIYANSRGYVYAIASNGSLPKAAFISVPVDGAVPLTVEFRDCSMYDPDSWEWDFDGDGVIDSYEKDPIFTYPTIGKYNVTLKVTNFKGSAEITREYYIDVQPRRPSIDVYSVASVPSVTYPGDDITYTLTIKNDGNLHLLGVTIDTMLIAHLREGGTEVRYYNSTTANALRNNVMNFPLHYVLDENDMDCTYLEAVYYVNHTAEGLSYTTSSGVYIKIPHDPISIDGNEDLIATAAAEGWHGDGSAEHPFIIENYYIVVTSVTWAGDIMDDAVPRAIELRNIDLHVVVRNCTTAAITNYPASMLQGTVQVYLNNTAIHVLMVNCSNITLDNDVITPWTVPAGYDSMLQNNLNYGVLMVNCHDNLIDNITMPAYGRHSVDTAVRLVSSHHNVIRNVVVENRFYMNTGPVTKPQVVLLKDSEDNLLDGLSIRSGGITLLNSDRTVITDTYAKNGLSLSNSDDCVIRAFLGYVQSTEPGATFISSAVTVTNCRSLWISDSTFTDLVRISSSSGLVIEDNTFIGSKLELVDCQDVIVRGNVFKQNCNAAIGMTRSSGVQVIDNELDMYWYTWMAIPGSRYPTYQYWHSGSGISLSEGCYNNTIAGNTILNSVTGVAARGTGNNITGNTVVNSTSGISISGSAIVLDNALEDCVHGIRLEASDGATVVGNRLSGSNLYIGAGAKNCRVDGNILQDGTFVLDVTSSTSSSLKTVNITDANTVNGGSFVFHIGKDLHGAVISEAGQLLLIEVSNVVIDGLAIDGGYNAITAISSHDIVIRNVALTNMEVSVKLSGCTQIVIEDSVLQGMEILSSTYCNVTRCEIDGSIVNGIVIDASRFIGLDNVVVSNGTSNGIVIRAQSQDIDIRHSLVENNGANGIVVQNSTRVSMLHNDLLSNYRNSIYFEHSDHCSVLNNTMVDGLNGILCESSSFIIIRNNVFAEHLRYGISFGPGSNNNEVVNNHFDGNRGSGTFFRSYFVQAEDLGTSNKWNDANGGNWWYDWQNMDGLAYTISSSPSVVDAKPQDLRYVDPWNAPGHDNHHSGSSSSTAPGTNTTAWTVDDFRLVDGSSVVSGAGMVFAQSVDVNGRTMLCAFGAETGELVWAVTIKSSRAASAFTPVYHLGLVYAPGGAYDAFTGKQVWKDTVTDHAGGGYIVYSSIAVIGDWGTSSLLAYNATTGQLLWTLPLEGSPESSPALCGGDIIVTTANASAGFVYRVSTSGSVVWEKTFDGYDNRTVGSATVVGDVIYLTTLNTFGYGHLYALNAADGAEIWAVEIISSASSVAVSGDRIYVSSGFDDALGRMTYCIDATDGSIIWRVAGVGSAYCSPAVADGKVIVGNHETGLLYGELWFLGTYVLDAGTGAEIWHSELGGSSSMVYDGRVYTIGDGMLVVFGEE